MRILLLTQLSGVSKLLHSLPARPPTKHIHAAKLVFHRCPRCARSSRHQSAAELFQTCYALRSFRQPTHLFLYASRTLLQFNRHKLMHLRICSLCLLLSLLQELRPPNATNPHSTFSRASHRNN